MLNRFSWLAALAIVGWTAPAVAQLPGAEVGFLFGQQRSTLQASGTNTVDIGDMTVNTYHGYLAYNFLDSDDTVRPYVMGGLGATSFSSVDFTRLNGQTGTIGGETRFSTTWGAGVKVYASPNVGARLGIQWTPTYIKSDAVGWCASFWGATSWAMPSMRTSSISAAASRSGSR